MGKTQSQPQSSRPQSQPRNQEDLELATHHHAVRSFLHGTWARQYMQPGAVLLVYSFRLNNPHAWRLLGHNSSGLMHTVVQPRVMALMGRDLLHLRAAFYEVRRKFAHTPLHGTGLMNNKVLWSIFIFGDMLPHLERTGFSEYKEGFGTVPVLSRGPVVGLGMPTVLPLLDELYNLAPALRLVGLPTRSRPDHPESFLCSAPLGVFVQSVSFLGAQDLVAVAACCTFLRRRLAESISLPLLWGGFPPLVCLQIEISPASYKLMTLPTYRHLAGLDNRPFFIPPQKYLRAPPVLCLPRPVPPLPKAIGPRVRLIVRPNKKDTLYVLSSPCDLEVPGHTARSLQSLEVEELALIAFFLPAAELFHLQWVLGSTASGGCTGLQLRGKAFDYLLLTPRGNGGLGLQRTDIKRARFEEFVPIGPRVVLQHHPGRLPALCQQHFPVFCAPHPDPGATERRTRYQLCSPVGNKAIIYCEWSD
eukprot:TRINITY_DN2406_c0_g1_i3.p1 TRINITY_DN2406_c0_g1~~TRINITY_DN2406_c0_g1_i3.p1  ORF type:complete len:475 (+),score=49.15 TRINITY_DN2406_c0_g1_i3:25-1449(+)